ncbi:MAG: hypothetical protein ACOX40_03820 [Bacilli bacterium]|jgi:hypothetical protein|nr:hypothetical protein [Acholeplasmataceae bacterium]
MFLSQIGNFIKDVLFYLQVILIIYLLYTEISKSTRKINKTPSFIALLVLLLITTLEPAIRGIINLGFDPLNLDWYLNLLIIIGIPLYVVLALTRKKRR